MNVLLIGLGRWGEKHLRVLGELGADVWVADLSTPRRTWAERHGVAPARIVSRYQDALPNVEAVAVVTPADTHHDIVETCLTAGHPCFVEKPLGMTAREGRRLARLAEEAGRILQVGHILRFHPVTATVQSAVHDGRLGAVRYVAGRFAGFKRPRTDVGVTHTDAIHYFDLFAHLLGRGVTSVLAFQRDYLGRGLDDLSVTIVNYQDVPAIVEANYFVPGAQRECVLTGERGCLVADYGTGTVTFHAGEFQATTDGWEALDRGKENLPVGDGEPLKLELAAFLAACAGSGPNLAPAEAGVRAVAVVEAASRSAALGRLVNYIALCNPDIIVGVIVRGEAWLRVNGFDERIPFGGNDYEFNERLLQTGMDLAVATWAFSFHQWGVSTKDAIRLNQFDAGLNQPRFRQPRRRVSRAVGVALAATASHNSPDYLIDIVTDGLIRPARIMAVSPAVALVMYRLNCPGAPPGGTVSPRSVTRYTSARQGRVPASMTSDALMRSRKPSRADKIMVTSARREWAAQE